MKILLAVVSLVFASVAGIAGFLFMGSFMFWMFQKLGLWIE